MLEREGLGGEAFIAVAPPPENETPVLVEIPHAGVAVDAMAMAFIIGPVRSIGRDADLYVDELYEAAPKHGAHLIVARTSRLCIDLNRAPDDFDGLTALGAPKPNEDIPRGLLWRVTTDGDPILARKLPPSETSRRIARFYEPYHARVAQILEAKRKRFGFAILLSAHSMPSTGRRGHVDVGHGRADVVPGSRGRTTTDVRVLDVIDAAGARASLTVRHDEPYRGGYTTAKWGRPTEGIHAVQIELARRVYMDEDTLERDPDGIVRAANFGVDVVRKLGALSLAR